MSSYSKFMILLSLPAIVIAGAAFTWWRRNRRKDFHPVGHVSGLFIYPVKSCKGIPLDSSLVLAQGLHHDRRWVIFNESSDRFVCQRQLPSLALVTPQFEDNLETLCLDAPGMDTLRITLPLNTTEFKEIDVFGISGEGQFAGEAAATWFSKYLNKPGLKLYHMTKPRYLASEKSWGKDMAPDDQSGFGDFAPLMICTMESLIALNEDLDDPVSVRRFRSNIIISGAKALDEYHWTHLKIRDVEIRKLKECDRCSMTTVDPEIGVKTGKEPLETLRRTRMPADRDQRYGNSPFFGIHATADKEGNIRIGDPVLARYS